MKNLISWTLRSSIVALSFVFGLGVLVPIASADMQRATNEQELLNLIEKTNVGWDWIPSCADGAYWSTHQSECKGGTGHDKIDSRNYGSSRYNLTNAQELVQKVHEQNVGWNWRPRCANGAHWSWHSNVCIGGVD